MAELHITHNSSNSFNINIVYENIVIESYFNIDFCSVTKIISKFRTLTEDQLKQKWEEVFLAS